MATGNHFLDHIPDKDLEGLRPFLRRVGLVQDQTLAQRGQPVIRIILPIDAIVSVILEMSDGTRAETRTIGREGGFGLLHALGAPTSFETVVTQISGDAYVMDRRELAAQAARNISLARCIVRHAQATLVQSGQSVACNALHDVRQRLCRWLLMTHDRLQRDELPLKQHHLAIMLAVQRTTVTAAASQLQREGMIRYTRGKVTIRDRAKLEANACECYAAGEEQVRMILGGGEAFAGA